MTTKKPPQNKATKPPETKPATPPENKLDGVVTMEDHFRRLLKAEHNQFVGVINRRQLHETANQARAFLKELDDE